MYNAMFKKNPFMSLWMSAANSAAGSARGLWMAEMQRQQNAMMQAFTKQVIDFWSGALVVPAAKAGVRRDADLREEAPLREAFLARLPPMRGYHSPGAGWCVGARRRARAKRSWLHSRVRWKTT